MPKRTLSPTPAPAAAPEAPPRMLRVLQDLENPAGGIWPAGTIIPMDALPAASIAILMERQIVMVYLDPAALAALPAL